MRSLPDWIDHRREAMALLWSRAYHRQQRFSRDWFTCCARVSRYRNSAEFNAHRFAEFRAEIIRLGASLETRFAMDMNATAWDYSTQARELHEAATWAQQSDASHLVRAYIELEAQLSGESARQTWHRIRRAVGVACRGDIGSVSRLWCLCVEFAGGV